MIAVRRIAEGPGRPPRDRACIASTTAGQGLLVLPDEGIVFDLPSRGPLLGGGPHQHEAENRHADRPQAVPQAASPRPRQQRQRPVPDLFELPPPRGPPCRPRPHRARDPSEEGGDMISSFPSGPALDPGPASFRGTARLRAPCFPPPPSPPSVSKTPRLPHRSWIQIID